MTGAIGQERAGADGLGAAGLEEIGVVAGAEHADNKSAALKSSAAATEALFLIG